jgi:hypothetical protein
MQIEHTDEEESLKCKIALNNRLMRCLAIETSLQVPADSSRTPSPNENDRLSPISTICKFNTALPQRPISPYR